MWTRPPELHSEGGLDTSETGWKLLQKSGRQGDRQAGQDYGVIGEREGQGGFK